VAEKGVIFAFLVPYFEPFSDPVLTPPGVPKRVPKRVPSGRPGGPFAGLFAAILARGRPARGSVWGPKTGSLLVPNLAPLLDQKRGLFFGVISGVISGPTRDPVLGQFGGAISGGGGGSPSGEGGPGKGASGRGSRSGGLKEMIDGTFKKCTYSTIYITWKELALLRLPTMIGQKKRPRQKCFKTIVK